MNIFIPTKLVVLVVLSLVAASSESSHYRRKKADEMVGSEMGDDSNDSSSPATSGGCKLESLVQCLFEPLDEWALVLYKLRDNIVAIDGDQCNTSRDAIRRCIEDKAVFEYECDQKTVLTVAARVTDLLMHKKNSGNLLRSYYVTAYVCSEQGRALRDRIGRTCLLQEQIGQMTFDTMKYLDERLSANQSRSTKERCVLLRERAHLMREIGNHQCAPHEPAHAGLLMCETIKMAFLKMYADTFGNGNCDFACTDERNDFLRDDTVGGSGRRMTDGDMAVAGKAEIQTNRVSKCRLTASLLAITSTVAFQIWN